MHWKDSRRLDFVLTEGVAHLAAGDAEEARDSGGFLAFRRFAHAVGLVLMSWRLTGGDGFIPLNYLSLNLVRDLIPRDPYYLGIVRDAVASLRKIIHKCSEFDEYAFLLMAEILLAQKAQDYDFADQLVEPLFGRNGNCWGVEKLKDCG